MIRKRDSRSLCQERKTQNKEFLKRRYFSCISKKQVVIFYSFSFSIQTWICVTIDTPRHRSRFRLFFHLLNVFLKQFYLYPKVKVAKINFDLANINFGASNGKVSSYYNRKLHLSFTKVDLSNFNFRIQVKLLEKHIEEMEKRRKRDLGLGVISRLVKWLLRFESVNYLYFSVNKKLCVLD